MDSSTKVSIAIFVLAFLLNHPPSMTGRPKDDSPPGSTSILRVVISSSLPRILGFAFAARGFPRIVYRKKASLESETDVPPVLESKTSNLLENEATRQAEFTSGGVLSDPLFFRGFSNQKRPRSDCSPDSSGRPAPEILPYAVIANFCSAVVFAALMLYRLKRKRCQDMKLASTMAANAKLERANLEKEAFYRENIEALQRKVAQFERKYSREHSELEHTKKQMELLSWEYEAALQVLEACGDGGRHVGSPQLKEEGTPMIVARDADIDSRPPDATAFADV